MLLTSGVYMCMYQFIYIYIYIYIYVCVCVCVYTNVNVGTQNVCSLIVMVPTLRTIMNSFYYYEYQENIHLGIKFTPA